MEKYNKPLIKTFSSSEAIELVGPAQAASATLNIYGGRTSSLDNPHIVEYRMVKTEINHGIIQHKEVYHA